MAQEVIPMIQQINNPEVVTARDAMRKYSGNYIGLVVVKQNLRSPDSEEGYVLFLADSYNEGLEECMGIDQNISVLKGYAVVEPIDVGGLEIIWR
jgi:hypothetical protein